MRTLANFSWDKTSLICCCGLWIDLVRCNTHTHTTFTLLPNRKLVYSIRIRVLWIFLVVWSDRCMKTMKQLNKNVASHLVTPQRCISFCSTDIPIIKRTWQVGKQATESKLPVCTRDRNNQLPKTSKKNKPNHKSHPIWNWRETKTKTIDEIEINCLVGHTIYLLAMHSTCCPQKQYTTS